jgi:hypothetical protein
MQPPEPLISNAAPATTIITNNWDAQAQRDAVQATVARRRRLAATLPPEPPGPPGDGHVLRAQMPEQPVQPLPVAVAGGSLPFVAGPPILPTTDEATTQSPPLERSLELLALGRARLDRQLDELFKRLRSGSIDGTIGEELFKRIDGTIGHQQQPAAYRFRFQDEKVDVLPEPPEPEDRDFAFDTYQDLLTKAQELHDRLRGTNSARRVCSSVERLLTALGSRFDDLRPGLLLSRSRSLEADRAAFGDELFADAIAMMDDTLQTLRDLLAAFPIVRRIEAEGLALHLDRSADAIPTIQAEMGAITTAAVQSGIVTEGAIGALSQNDAAIEDATDPVVRTGLIADKLLVFRNLAGAMIGGVMTYGRIALAAAGPELGGLAGKSWQVIKDELPKGIGTAARIAPVIVLMTLAGVIAGPIGSIASAVPVFGPISDALKNMIKDPPKDVIAGDGGKNPKRGRHGKTR